MLAWSDVLTEVNLAQSGLSDQLSIISLSLPGLCSHRISVGRRNVTEMISPPQSHQTHPTATALSPINSWHFMIPIVGSLTIQTLCNKPVWLHSRQAKPAHWSKTDRTLLLPFLTREVSLVWLTDVRVQQSSHGRYITPEVIKIQIFSFLFSYY